MFGRGFKLSLGIFFTIFILFLYGPTLSILVLSFQGPNGGLTFPMRGFSTFWFESLFDGVGVIDIWGAFGRSIRLGMMASGVFAGVHDLDWAYDRTDAAGARFGDELERIGWVGDAAVGGRPVAAFFELHIEQGPILEDSKTDIGVVTHGQGLNWIRVTLTGKEAHTGSTPMPSRVNAGLGMAQITVLAHQIALAHAPHAVGAVGHCEIFPNSTNIIPGKAIFTIDFRSPDPAVIAAMHDELRTGASAIAKTLGLGIDFELAGAFDPVAFDPACIDRVRAAADRLGYSHMDLVSGAGHDAFWMSRVAPTAMIMCPCVDGLSHNEAEEISQDWAAASANVLFHAVVETAGLVSDD